MFDLEGFLRDIPASLDRFMMTWKSVRVCPEKIEASGPELSFNLLVLPVSLGIFVAARSGIAGASFDFTATIALTLISALIAFFTGFVYILVCPGPNSIENSKKWGTFLVMTWLFTLVLTVIVDALPFWLYGERSTTYLLSKVFGPDFAPGVGDIFRCVFFSGLAIISLLVRTKFMDKGFKANSACALTTCGIGVAVNSILLDMFLYQHVI